MNNKFENRYFLIIKKNKFLFTAYDSTKENIFTKEIFIGDHSINNIYYLLENYLEKNILKIEKDLKSFVENIYIIFESDSFFEVQSSIKHNLINNKIKDSLVDIRNQFHEYSPGYNIIHMIINKYIINGTTYNVLPEDFHNQNLVIEINFICLEDKIISKLKKIFSKYQISINKILSYEYLKKLNNYNGENIVKVANENINQLNVNEVFIVKKIRKNQGFFEKFFNFFN
jgi:hypothetical protein